MIASGGKLGVSTHNRCMTITPHPNGGASVDVRPAVYPTGTQIEISFGPDMPEDEDDDALAWARAAILMAEAARTIRATPRRIGSCRRLL